MLTPASQIRASLLSSQTPLLHSVPVHPAGSSFLPVCQTPRNDSPKVEQWSVPQYVIRTENLASRRLLKELNDLVKNPVPDCHAGPMGENLFQWMAAISGPRGTLYEGGIYFVEIALSRDYPFKSPKVTFLTRIFHCNINSTESLNLDVLNDGWQPTFSISTILLEIIGLLMRCKPQSSINNDVAKLYFEDRKRHDETARLWTQRYAS